ncbi:MAG: glycosyltransferase [Actinomycetota bacterium]|nr:glycosyltransferase [Actinomycetota bacterium]
MAAVVVRIGIVSWNTAALLDRCLRALPAALAGTEAEVVVVDNASVDQSADRAAAHSGVTVIRNNRNAGYGRAMNQALAGTDAPVLIALNPDTEPPPGSLSTLVVRLLADPGLGLVAPQLLDGDGSPQYTARRFPSLGVAAAMCFLPVRAHGGALGRHLLLEAAAQPARPVDVDWAIGAVHVIRASALRGRTPYDERWFMYVEDIELCWWLAARGWRRRFEADITIPHVGNAAGAQAWGDDYERRCFDAIYDWYRRDVGARRVRAVAALNAVNAASRAAVGQLARRPAAHVADRRQAARYHAGIVRHGPPPPGGSPPPGDYRLDRPPDRPLEPPTGSPLEAGSAIVTD